MLNRQEKLNKAEPLLCKEVKTRSKLLFHTIASNLLRLCNKEIMCPDNSISWQR